MSRLAREYMRHILDEAEYLIDHSHLVDKIVWDVVVNQVPKLAEHIRQMLAEE